jgi:uncharacterized membrane protein HdeD (DUF308 family)
MVEAIIPDSRANIWWVFLLQGLAGVVLGLMLITDTTATVMALVTVLGFFWLFGGVMWLVRIFVDHSVPRLWSLLSGLFGVAAGLLVLRHPLLAALTVPTVIVIVLGIEGLIIGAVEIIAGFGGAGLGSFIAGALNLLIGLLLLSSPVAASLAVPFVFGVLLLIQGIGLLIWAFRLRSA